MKPTQEQVTEWSTEAGLYASRQTDDKFDWKIIYAQQFATIAYEAGRKDENEACASLEVHLITPTRNYATMSPLDCYEAALMDEAMAFREAIRARIKR